MWVSKDEIDKTARAFKDLMKMTIDEIKGIKCKYCESKDIVKFGFYKSTQRYYCRACERKFSPTDTLPKGKIPIRQIADAVSMYYRGMSLNSISEHIEQEYGTPVTNAGVYNWIMRYSKQAETKAKEYVPNVGKEWVADETVLKIGGQNVWFWDIIDVKTRFLLASRISLTRTTQDAKKLVEMAVERAGGVVPDIISTDQLKAYIDGIELALGADTIHIQAKPFDEDSRANYIERFHGTLKDRTNIMRGLHKIKTAETLLGGWLVFYNFFRPHDSLNGKTPAQEAGIKYPFANWEGVVRSNKVIIEVPESRKYPPEKHYRIRMSKKELKRIRNKRAKRSSRNVIATNDTDKQILTMR